MPNDHQKEGERMKKWKSMIVLALLLCLIPCAAALAKTGKVTASSLNIRKSADSDSKVVGTLREGATVTINETKGSWYKITAGGKTGYVYKSYIKIIDSSSGSSSGTNNKKNTGNKDTKKSENSDGTCGPGDSGSNVRKVQERLKKLGYYSAGVDGDYGNVTKTAVKNFQRKNGLNVTGTVNKNTLTKLNSSSAKKADAKDSDSKSENSDGTCGPGDSGNNVKKVQRRLKALGYYNKAIDGDYGSGTKKAVMSFQKKNGLSQTGRVNKNTLTKLNSSSAKKANDSDSGKTENLNWFNGGSRKIPKGATFKVKDIKTGKVFTVKRWSGANHLDAEPYTKSDTKTLKSIYGGWSWKRRAILVKYNGHVYAASMNGMPHGTQTITNNNFDGHFCIHFYGSKTHGSKKVDAMHQNCEAEALKHSW